VIEQKDIDDYINRDNFIRLQTQLKELFRINNANFFEINDDYEGEIKNIYEWIDRQVQAKRHSGNPRDIIRKHDEHPNQ
jgi:putative acetyltransferase